MKITTILLRIVQFVVLTVLFAVIYMRSSMSLVAYMPPMSLAEPGPIPSPLDFIFVSAVQSLVIMIILLSSFKHGWKLAIFTGFAYYGVTTFMAQIEAWYFLSDLTLPPDLLPRTFIAGLATAFIFVPLAVLILWKVRRPIVENVNLDTRMPLKQWGWKLSILSIVYLLLYFGAGYFIAWQNPELQTFYGGGNPTNFFMALVKNWQNDSFLYLFQIGRSLLWVLFALPVMRMTRGNAWIKALVVAMLLGIPMNIGHIMANPLIPAASVRFSHMIETSTSTFVFGLIATWLLHRRHYTLPDLFGIRHAELLKQVQSPSI